MSSPFPVPYDTLHPESEGAYPSLEVTAGMIFVSSKFLSVTFNVAVLASLK